MSMIRTIAVTGTSEHDAARIAALLERHRHKLSAPWEKAQAADADLLVVDIESLYGQMDWLRARSRGRLVIAYTSAAEPIEPEFSLRKPVVSRDLVALLNRISAGLSAGKSEAAPPIAAGECFDIRSVARRGAGVFLRSGKRCKRSDARCEQRQRCRSAARTSAGARVDRIGTVVEYP